MTAGIVAVSLVSYAVWVARRWWEDRKTATATVTENERVGGGGDLHQEQSRLLRGESEVSDPYDDEVAAAVVLEDGSTLFDLNGDEEIMDASVLDIVSHLKEPIIGRKAVTRQHL